MNGEAPSFDDAPLLTKNNDGWTWIAKVRPGLYHWSRLNSDEIPTELNGLKVLSQPKGADVTWRLASASAGAGYFLAGDSAAVLDPASAHGVLKAISSGMMAAHSIIQILRKNASPEKVILGYRKWVSDWFFHDVAKLTQLYSSRL
jgi:flavin-dependent dehydrogenase